MNEIEQKKTKNRKKKTVPPPQPGKTHVIFIIDESGSMEVAAHDVRGGFNQFVSTLRSDGLPYTLTAIKFGTRVRPLFANLSLEQVPLLSEKNYIPMDTTALYDALGYVFEEAKREFGTQAHPFGTEPVICLIMTDGFENASRSFEKATIVTEIKARTDAGNWSFIYMGADQDAWSEARKLGITQGNTLSYASATTEHAFASAAFSTSATARSGNNQTFNFFESGKTPPSRSSTGTDEHET